MTRKLWIDIETYSSVDLPKTGVYRYAASPDFMILMAAWSTDGETVHTALTYDEIAAIPGLLDPDVKKVAHNAQFERVCFSAFFDVDGYLPPEQWHDTQAIAAEYGWPQSLGMLGQALDGEKKDEAGTRLINLFSKPNRKGTRTLPEEKPMEWLEYIAYCEQDVYTLIDVDSRLGGWPNALERSIFWADQRINDRGIAIDTKMARRAVAAAEENQVEQVARVKELSGVENPNSVAQMRDWLKEQDVDVPNLRAETVEDILKGDLPGNTREVLELRQELALVASKKYTAALGAVLPDDRLRGTLKFFGAHTGRWAGRGTQLQNLPRAAFMKKVDGKSVHDEATENAAILDLELGMGGSAETLKKLVRPMFRGPFTVVDYSAIEARVVAWLAGEQWALDAFKEGRDIYVETGQRMGGLSRSDGKIAVLALGYNGAINSLKAMGDGFWIDSRTGAIADGPGEHHRPMTDKEIFDKLVAPWRKANPKIVELWQLLQEAYGDVEESCGPHLSMSESHDNLGRAVHMHLPSGRAITYHGVKWEKFVLIDPATGKPIRKQGWRYANPKNPFNPKMRIATYGGRLTENATQAVARDIMAAALVRLEEAGYHVVGHVHDEILVEGRHDVEEISRIMCELPSWATGLPVDGEGFTCERYRKG